MDWHPFETAPKTGEEFLAFYFHQNIYALVYFDRVRKYWLTKGSYISSPDSGVVWMRLPEPPK